MKNGLRGLKIFPENIRGLKIFGKPVRGLKIFGKPVRGLKIFVKPVRGLKNFGFFPENPPTGYPDLKMTSPLGTFRHITLNMAMTGVHLYRRI